jgi:hypothetical protein
MQSIFLIFSINIPIIIFTIMSTMHLSKAMGTEGKLGRWVGGGAGGWVGRVVLSYSN